MELQFHPSWHHVVAESHLRPFRPVRSDTAVSFVAFLRDASQPSALGTALRQYFETQGLPAPHEVDRFFVGDIQGMTLRWERHTEFDTLQIYAPLNDQSGLFAVTPWHRLPLALKTQLPDNAVCAGHVVIKETSRFSDALFSELNETSLVCSQLMGGKLSLITDFDPGAGGGFQRYVLQSNQANAFELGRALQRLIEIELYRTLASLTLPLIRDNEAALTRLFQTVSDLVADMGAGPDPEQDQTLLEELLKVEVALGQINTRCAYRISATRAYVPLVEERIAALKEEKQAGFQRYSSFVNRRFQPMRRAVMNFGDRLEILQARIGRLSSLLQTRISVKLEKQNSQLLHSMEQNARKQLKLQHAVELVGAVAITYYAVSILGVALKPLMSSGLAAWLKLASIPVFFIATLLVSGWLSGERKKG